MAQPDPSQNVPQDLIPHVHLISSFRYPALPRPDLNEVAKWLMNAPQVARDRAPVFWTYLDKPSDGTTLLTWQPLQRLGTNFATDGYIWAPPEQVYKHDLGNGLMLEVYWLKAGYIPGEQYALHSRRRFRLVPVPGHPNPPQPDLSLFIVHYGPSEPNDRIPVNMIPYDERVNNIMQQRHYLQRAGQIRRKEFMLSDRVNWPHLPDPARQQMGPQSTPRGVPQQMAYPPQAAPGPPSKRARHAQNQAQQQSPAQGAPHPDAALDDEEDISRGDMFDNLTPRELSLSRYQQNHEWMEEILSSPYRMNQITPPDLGLGLKGELASLTEGIFAAQGADATVSAPEKPYVGRLDPGLASEFQKRVQEHIEKTKSEIEQMRAEHEEAMAKLKQTSVYGSNEKDLRNVAAETGTEMWRVDVASEASDEDSKIKTSGPTLDEIVAKVEQMAGSKIEANPRIKRVQDGGYQAPAPEPVAPAANAQMSRQPSQAGSQASGLLLGESDVDMGNTAGGLLDEMHTGFSSTNTPINFPTPQAQASAAHSGSGTPANANVPSPAPAAPAATADVSMGGTTDGPPKEPSGNAADQGTESGDWVVVPKGGATPDANTERDASAAAASADDEGADSTPKQAAATSATTSVPAPAPTPAAAPAAAPTPVQASAQAPAAAPAPAPAQAKPPSAAATPAVTDGGGSGAMDQNDFSSLGDLDSAGDALAGYDAPALDGSAGELGEGLDLNMDMEDSAFGDAFHGVGEPSATPGEGQGQDM